MRHHNHNRKLSREKGQRKALLKALAVSLVMKEKIETTEAKAKELRPFVERLITYGKKETLSGKRLVKENLSTKAADKLVKTISPRFKERAGGYVRIVKIGRAKGDGARMALIEFV